ncbi:MAG: PEGA domain-containing protein [Atribacterota bacterium]|jgi:hypothetical protein|nr:PEGA domain-containing protein [Atribacterota bacterium]MDD4895257.1 PEGA domain-containing protein [Atribacterota bacterium]MDD5637575.1 PEGA domain-containing protein [Atribacterota bacterium]MDX9799571.1 PEGA domain-containing protein [Bacteroidales bacterium]
MRQSLFFDKCIKILSLTFVITFLCLTIGLSGYAQQLRYGTLSINSNPSGAGVFLDNQYKGDTPLNLKDVPVGQYSIKLVLSGYEDWNSSVAVLPILTVKIAADLVPLAKPAVGSIAVNSNPQGARVYLDNAYKGQTPLNLRDITVGRHTLKLVLADYQEWNSEITITSSQTARIFADLEYQRATGSIAVNSNPKGADIYLDDNYEGLTPLNLTQISVGSHIIKLILPGYREWISEITVSSEQVSRISVDLESQPKYGSISIKSNQGEAKIFLNGTYITTTSIYPKTLQDIKTGYYEMVIIKDGFRAWIGELEVFPGEVTSIEVTMTEIFK